MGIVGRGYDLKLVWERCSNDTGLIPMNSIPGGCKRGRLSKKPPLILLSLKFLGDIDNAGIKKGHESK